jgi:hypothetical protein
MRNTTDRIGSITKVSFGWGNIWNINDLEVFLPFL